MNTLLFILMMAPSITDMDLENNSHFIGVYEDSNLCDARAEYLNNTEDNHYWCETSLPQE